MRVLVTGGGTGGHVYPAISIIRGLQKKLSQVEVLYVGTRRGLEADIVPKEGIPFRTITVTGLERKLSWRAVTTVCKGITGMVQARQLLKQFRPDVVIGTGGYVSGPVVLLAALMGYPTLLHEQNALPGLTNRWLARFVDVICVTFPDSLAYFPEKKGRVTGLPVRPEILRVTRDEGIKKLGLDFRKKTLLALGGSRGARSINRAMLSVVQKYLASEALQIIHVTGRDGYQETMAGLERLGIDVVNSGNITIKPYLYHIEYALAAADLVVARAGAAFLAEMMIKGIPGILIPYPYAAENHQEFNARSLERQGAAVVIPDVELNGQRLLATVENLMADQERLRRMSERCRQLGKPGALEDIVNAVMELAGGKSKRE
ncbi:undecaprenyldiphospho-muramoylpentapeptide beta-N-acetylglucosaminyltransferase [Calderihabitans maritimus]|uniref:UDP-N-acetylglucosamine--N-acetylmuramyl-(pentapeptide) pyrophosphoryl-undecaprenol N-acetylglucosamine transferase n=1 Tax=Calderihabitans maritimus TaxID=1246530 RepID=A0A1Z5HRL0_9FIRM|nr:undecaprenyldiphospho-muramoylpentapeptide beta-N-acetylglucosaminyltransferase [Calderihabitans maritimus]GAW92144.1 UDP-N-acetylglucosamine--N-acetylmuramyl-(pentapeptide) pyrophosphoryl-UDP N- acetylglucosamine transferase [Calderihabitans maritimus]